MSQIRLCVEDNANRQPDRFLTDRVAHEHHIQFELSAGAPNADTVNAIREVQQLKANPGLGKTYTDIDQMMGELLANV